MHSRVRPRVRIFFYGFLIWQGVGVFQIKSRIGQGWSKAHSNCQLTLQGRLTPATSSVRYSLRADFASYSICYFENFELVLDKY